MKRFSSLFHRNSLFMAFLAFSHAIFAQNGELSGRVYNDVSNEPLDFATVFLQNTEYGTYTDSAGLFNFTALPVGLYNLEVRFTGYAPKIIYEIQVTNSKPYYVEIGLKEEAVSADSVVIRATPFKKTEEAPLSLQTIGANEIQRNPGGNRDISKVIQSLPGVSSQVSFRNDILIRGGAPNENRFYLDDIEVPNINHFSTQGGSGGPVGMMNVDFISEVDFYSGAFPANRGNTLSSVFQFKQRDARKDRVGFTATLGASDLAMTVEGPSSKNSSFLFSVRRSYLQLLFKALALPFLPTYNDYQYKHKIKLGQKDELSIISLGALDQFSLNLGADSTEYQKLLLGNLPVQTQWNYTIGTSYKHFGEKGFWTLVLSRNMINFDSYKHPNNDESLPKRFDYNSQEIENKFRAEHVARYDGWKIGFGAGGEYAKYLNRTYNQLPFTTIDFSSELKLFKYGAFAQVSRSLLEDRLTLSLGTRIDGNSYSDKMANPFSQFSPRLSASYLITPRLSANFNTGIYYQLPAYTVMGYRNTLNNELQNQGNLTYIKSQQLVGGFAYTTEQNSKISIEAFYKKYSNYPFLLRDSISLANLGADFGAVGNDAAVSTNEGRCYGGELLLQQRLYKGFYGILAYTLVWSEFQDKNGVYTPSSWDARHTISLTGGKKFKKNWELGARWLLNSGNPYTPVDTAFSSLIPVWNATQQGLPNYNQLNSQRLKPYHQLNVRVDKKYFFEKWSLNVYADVQNIYANSIPGAPIFTVVKDANGQSVVNPNDPTRYQSKFLENSIGILQPSIGIVITY